MLSSEDRALIARFLAATSDLSPERAGQLLNGISGATIRRYRDGKLPTRLTTETRLAMKTLLQSHGRVSGSQLPQVGRGVAEQQAIYGRGSATAPGGRVSGAGTVEMSEEGAAESDLAYELLWGSVRAAMGKDSGGAKEYVIDQLESAIIMAKRWGWPVGPLYEMLGRVQHGDIE